MEMRLENVGKTGVLGFLEKRGDPEKGKWFE